MPCCTIYMYIYVPIFLIMIKVSLFFCLRSTFSLKYVNVYSKLHIKVIHHKFIIYDGLYTEILSVVKGEGGREREGEEGEGEEKWEGDGRERERGNGRKREGDGREMGGRGRWEGEGDGRERERGEMRGRGGRERGEGEGKGERGGRGGGGKEHLFPKVRMPS